MAVLDNAFETMGEELPVIMTIVAPNGDYCHISKRCSDDYGSIDQWDDRVEAVRAFVDNHKEENEYRIPL